MTSFSPLQLDQAQYAWSAPLHYVNPKHDPMNGQCSYDDARDCTNDFCVTSAVSNFTTQLKSGSGSAKSLEDALKFLAHFVGDMHQPLHGLFPPLFLLFVCV